MECAHRVGSTSAVPDGSRETELAIARLFGANVRAARKAADMTQEALAEVADLHSTFISNVERGYRVPSIATAVRLSEGLKVHISDLFDGVHS